MQYLLYFCRRNQIKLYRQMKKGLFILCLAALLLPSCMSTRTSLGDYKAVQGEEYRYARGKQCYLFWGLLPLGRTSVATPTNGVCQVRTSFRFIDALVTTLTAGIFSMQTIRVYAKRGTSPEPAYAPPAAPVAAPVATPQQTPQQAPPQQEAAPAPAVQQQEVKVAPKEEVAPAPKEEVKQVVEEPKEEVKAAPKEEVKPAAEQPVTSAPQPQDNSVDPEAYQVIFKQADMNHNGVIDDDERASFERMLKYVKK